MVHIHKYFHNFSYFIYILFTKSQKTSARATATLFQVRVPHCVPPTMPLASLHMCAPSSVLLPKTLAAPASPSPGCTHLFVEAGHSGQQVHLCVHVGILILIFCTLDKLK